MKRKEDQPLSKHTLNLYEGQLDKLQELHPRLGAAKVIRMLIKKHLDEVLGGAAESFKLVPETQIKLEEIL